MTSSSRNQQIERRPVFTADCDPGFASFLHTPGIQPPANQRAAAFAIKPDFCNTGGPCGLAAANSAHGLRGEALVREALHRVSQTAGIGLQSSGILVRDHCNKIFAPNPIRIPGSRGCGASWTGSGRAVSAGTAARSSDSLFRKDSVYCNHPALTLRRLDGTNHGKSGSFGNYGNFGNSGNCEVPLVASSP